MDVEFEREDWLLVALAAAVVIPAGYSFVSGDGFEPETDIEKYCVDLAENVESNHTQIDSCSCVPPSQVDDSRFDAPEKVVNATELFLLDCATEDGQDLVFPIRRLKPGYGNESLQTNETEILG